MRLDYANEMEKAELKNSCYFRKSIPWLP